MNLIKRLPFGDRPREKALIYGVETLSNAELIAILLCTGSKDNDVLELSQNIINESGSLTNLANYSIQELTSFKGIKKVKAMRIKVALELHNRIEKEKNQRRTKVSTLLEAALFFKSSIINSKQENLLIMLLNNANEIINIRNISLGSSNNVLFSINSIITIAIKGSANKIIISHNHPSNNVIPSKEDIEKTEELQLICSVIGINFIDHLIIGEYSFYSILNKSEHKLN